MDEKYQLATLGVRAGQARSQFQEHSEALFLTSSFVFDSAAQAAARFAGDEPGIRLLALHQSDGDDVPGAPGRARGRRGLRRHRLGHGGDPRHGDGAAQGRRPHRVLRTPCSAPRCSSSPASSAASASRPPSSLRPGPTTGQAAVQPEHEAVLPRDALQSADRDLRHRRARRHGARAPARCWRWTTASARRRCSGRSSWAPTW